MSGAACASLRQFTARRPLDALVRRVDGDSYLDRPAWNEPRVALPSLGRPIAEGHLQTGATMPETIVLFHSALGLRPAVHRFADQLRSAGHTVITPDFFDGDVFDDLNDGVVRRDAIGIPGLVGLAQAAVADLPAEVVYAGFSMGASSAEFLAATRDGARAAILMHGVVPPALVGVSQWPPVPVQIHYTTGDPWVEAAQVDELVAAVEAAEQPCDVFTYPGSGHLFADEDTEDYDEASATLMLARLLGFLDGV
jgi:dienelactone hydrolase